MATVTSELVTKAQAARVAARDLRKLSSSTKNAALEELKKKETEQIDKVIADLKKKTEAEVVTNDSGLRYLITKVGQGEAPEKGDQLTVHVMFKLLDGKVIDDTRKNNVTSAIYMHIDSVAPTIH